MGDAGFFLSPREAYIIVALTPNLVLSRLNNLSFQRSLDTGREENVQTKAMSLLLLSPGPPKPKKNKIETLNYPSRSLAILNRR